MTWTDLKDFVNASSADDTYVQSCYATAQTLVDGFVGSRTIPQAVLDRCYLVCGSELFHARQAPNGIAQFQGMDGAPMRIARDPMTPVYPLLGQYMVVGI